MIYIDNVQREDIKQFETQAKKDGLLFTNDTVYRVARLTTTNDIVGFAGVRIFTDKLISKTLYVLPQYRGLGIAKMLIKDQVDTRGGRTLEANCTDMSLGIYISYGARVVKKYKNNITKVVIK